MIIHNTPSFMTYFGNKQTEISLDEINRNEFTTSLQKVLRQTRLKKIAFPHQVHGVDGFDISSEMAEEKPLNLFYDEGDFLTTQQQGVGIGVVTADCLPIVLYEPSKHVAVVIHAGWRGSIDGVVLKAAESMINQYGVSLDKVQVVFGPAAKSCCYEVQQDFYDKFMEQGCDQMAFVKKKDKIYFDNAIFVSFQLRNLGIQADNIYTKYNVCTICDASFCSYRRDKNKAGRQVTVVALH